MTLSTKFVVGSSEIDDCGFIHYIVIKIVIVIVIVIIISFLLFSLYLCRYVLKFTKPFCIISKADLHTETIPVFVAPNYSG